jgi:DNA primase
MDVQAEVLAVAQSYLRKVGRSGAENIMAICPFHRKLDGSEESTPSFSMSLTKGVYFCHACHAKGSLYTFFKELGLDRQTINFRYGLLLDGVAKNMPARPDPGRPREIWVDLESAIDEALLGLFDHDVTALLPDFDPETLNHFDVGWDGWWNRVTFPIRDMDGKLIAISGRAVYPEQEPRYKIYEEEYKVWDFPPRYGWNKRTALWNACAVYPELHLHTPDQGFIVVVEGFKAAMWVWQAGITNVVALLGSYLSWEQGWILERLGVPVYLFLDNNAPGWAGQIDAAARLTEKGVTVRFIEYPLRLQDDEDAQPDSLTELEVLQQKARAPHYRDWLLKQHGERHGIRQG